MTRVTRRRAALALLTPAAAVSQQSATSPKPADELGAAREQVRRDAELLRKFKVPVATEPSFAFRP
jgi:hypothetical protein